MHKENKIFKCSYFSLIIKGLIIFFLFCETLSSQPAFLNQRFRHYSIRDGLSQNSGRAIIQDKLGYIWIATEIGLNCFNGTQFKVFKHNPADTNSLSNNYINCLMEDDKGQIWIGTDGGGVDVYNPKLQKFKHIYFSDTNQLVQSRKNSIRNFIQTFDGHVWVGTSYGMFRLNEQGKILTHIVAEPKNKAALAGRHVIAFCEINQQLWLATVPGGLHVMDLKTGVITRVFEQIPQLRDNNLIIENIVVLPEGNLMLASNGEGLWQFSPVNMKLKNFRYNVNDPNTIPSDNVIRILKDRKHNLWVATSDSGICYFNTVNEKCFRFKHEEQNRYSLVNDNIHSLCLDESGMLWIGTHFSGVNTFNTNAKPFFHLYTDTKKKIRLKGIGPLMMDCDKNIWAGSTFGLYKIALESQQIQPFFYQKNNVNSISNDYVSCLWQAPDKNIWIGTDNGLNIFHYQSKKIFRFNAVNSHSKVLDNLSIWSISPDKNGKVWIGTWGTGIYVVDLETGNIGQHLTASSTGGSMANNNVNCIFTDSKGRVWVGAWEGGLHLYKPETNTFVNYRHDKQNAYSISHNIVMAILEDKAGDLWISTFGGGINKFNVASGKFEHFTENEGLVSNTVFGMLPDNKGHFWISTSNGISRFNPENREFKNYDESDGLQSNEFSQWGFCHGQNNTLIFGGMDGLSVFNPDSIYDSKYDCNVYFSDFKIFNKSVLPSVKGFLRYPVQFTKQINITYRESVFSFDFCATDYGNPSKIQYAYRMVGYEEDWNYVGNKHSATYTNLNHGDYVFEVKATNADGVWSKNIASINIYIKPPFWKTNWFYAIVIVMILFAINFYIRFREYKLKRDKKILEQRVEERTAEVVRQKQEIEQKNEMLTLQNEEITCQRDEIALHRNEIEKKNKNITDSIKYALRIQQSLLPSNDFINKIFPQSFIFYQPKDIVSGDFYWFDYWFNEDEEKLFFTAIDCTGHGVPGAFMSIMAYNLLTKATGEFQLSKPSEILDFLSNGIYSLFRQKATDVMMVKDGMDLALCVYDVNTKMLHYSGAYNQLVFIRNGELTEYKADKVPIGEPFVQNFKGYTNHEIAIMPGDTVYVFSDGFADQFGAVSNKKFTIRKLRELLLSVQHLPMNEQEQQIRQAYYSWKGNKEQIDDVLLIGIRF